ncbi:MAG: AMP-binding protein [Burkholderiales bacterium]
MARLQSQTGAKVGMQAGRIGTHVHRIGTYTDRADTLASRGNLVRCLRGHASERPSAIAFVGMINDPSKPTTLTYGELDRRARAIGTSLQGMRLAGQPVVLAYPPGLEFITAFFGALYAGCVAVPLDQPRRRTLDVPKLNRERRVVRTCPQRKARGRSRRSTKCVARITGNCRSSNDDRATMSLI